MPCSFIHLPTIMNKDNFAIAMEYMKFLEEIRGLSKSSICTKKLHLRRFVDFI